jgi:hypothetical protein
VYSVPSRSTVVALLLGLAVILSGCAGKAAPPAGNGDANQPVNPTFGADTGAVRGLVLDEEGLPIAGAEAALSGRPGTARTNGAGEFALSDVPPGRYSLLVAALRFAPHSQSVDVAAGAVTAVEMALRLLPEEGVAYQRAIGPVPGRFFCGFGTGVLSGPCKGVGWSDPNHPVESAWRQATSGGENNIFRYERIVAGNRTLESDVLRTVVVEITWTPSSAGARWMQASLEQNPPEGQGRNATNTIVWTRAAGEGPLKLVGTPGERNHGGNRDMPLTVDGFTVGVFPTVDPNAPKVTNPTNNRDILLGASAYTDQAFQVWITLFFNEPAPEDYSMLDLGNR